MIFPLRKAVAAWRFLQEDTPGYNADAMKSTIPQPDRCIVCTSCTLACPVASHNLNFPGPRMTGPAHERFRLLGLGEDKALHYCSNCKNCDIVCPCDVPISTFIMRARAEACRETRPSLRDWILAHGEVLARLLRFVPSSLKNFGMRFPPMRFFLDGLGISRKAPLPKFAPQTFSECFSRFRQVQGLPRKVVFFPGCFVDIYDPESGLDMMAVLNRAGYEVILPKNFVCCGLPLVANGFWEDAHTNAERNMLELARWKNQGLAVLTGCPSCALMFKEDYAQYFPDLTPHQFSPILADICEFLLGCIERGELVLPYQATDAMWPVLYHAPCHLRAQGMGLPGLELLKEIPGTEVRNADAGCCGISGSYGFKKDKYNIAMRVGADLFTAMHKSPARVCASECGTCRLQMRHGGGKETVHPVSLLWRFLKGDNA